VRIPLFPLNLVLFPGQMLPLHIFEERYKAMLQRCLRERIPFGIVLTRESTRGGRGTPHSIGTCANLTAIDEVPEGRCTVQAPHHGNCYHVVCRGEERFRVTALDRREAEYLVAEIEEYPDEAAPPPALAMVGERVASLFDEYYRNLIAIMGGWQREVAQGQRTLMLDVAALVASQARQNEAEAGGELPLRPRAVPVPALPNDHAAMSYSVAAELNVGADVKQDLLEAPSALTRLQKEAEVITEELPELQERLRMQYRRRFGAFGMMS
jgi:Lon protease-like protein